MKIKRHGFPHDKSIGYLIHRLDMLLTSGLSRSFRTNECNITPEQWGVLCKLCEGDGVHQAELSKQVGKDEPGLTRILGPMARNGLITRKKVPEDKRLSRIYVTEEGRNTRKKAFSPVKAFLLRTLAGLKQEDVETLRRILEHIANNLEGIESVKQEKSNAVKRTRKR
jgi:MarR family transcriptional regulator, organic hydroperoxide resistance regulator